jgi:hypothetical protein
MMKKEWTKPKLIRLYSGRPEEAVLAGCKGDSDLPGEQSGAAGGWDCGGPNDCAVKGS